MDLLVERATPLAKGSSHLPTRSRRERTTPGTVWVRLGNANVREDLHQCIAGGSCQEVWAKVECDRNYPDCGCAVCHWPYSQRIAVEGSAALDGKLRPEMSPHQLLRARDYLSVGIKGAVGPSHDEDLYPDPTH